MFCVLGTMYKVLHNCLMSLLFVLYGVLISVDCSNVDITQGTEPEVTNHHNSDHWHHIQLLASRLSQLPNERLDRVVVADTHSEVACF